MGVSEQILKNEMIRRGKMGCSKRWVSFKDCINNKEGRYYCADCVCIAGSVLGFGCFMKNNHVRLHVKCIFFCLIFNRHGKDLKATPRKVKLQL